MANQFPQWDDLVAETSAKLSTHAANQQAIARARLDRKMPDLKAKHSKAAKEEDPIGIKSCEFVPADLGAKTMAAFQTEAQAAVDRLNAAATEFGEAVQSNSAALNDIDYGAQAAAFLAAMQEKLGLVTRDSSALGELAGPEASPDRDLVVKAAVGDDRFGALEGKDDELDKEFDKEWTGRIAKREGSALDFVRESCDPQEVLPQIDDLWENNNEFDSIRKSAVSAKASVEALVARLKQAVSTGETQVSLLEQKKKDKQKQLKEKRDEFKTVLARLFPLAVELEDADIEVGVVDLQLEKTRQDLDCERSRLTITSAAADSAKQVICQQETTAKTHDMEARQKVKNALQEVVQKMMPALNASAQRQQVALELCSLMMQQKDKSILSLEAKVKAQELATRSAQNGVSGQKAIKNRAGMQSELRKIKDKLEDQRKLRQEMQTHQEKLQEQYQVLLSLKEHGAKFDEEKLKGEATKLAKNAHTDFDLFDVDDGEGGSPTATGGSSSSSSQLVALPTEMQELLERMMKDKFEKEVDARVRQALAEQQSNLSEAGTIDQYDIVDPSSY